MTDRVAIDDVLERKTSTRLQSVLGWQPLWITVAVVAIAVVMSFVNSNFLSTGNWSSKI